MKPQFLIFPLIENKEYATRVTGIPGSFVEVPPLCRGSLLDDRLTQEERQDVGKKT